MKQSFCLEVPMGYRFVERVETMYIWQAEQRLLSRNGLQYSHGLRQGDRAKLYGRYLICPYCGKSYAANTNTMPAPASRSSRGDRPVGVNREAVEAWASMQLSFFDPEGYRILPLAGNTAEDMDFDCPHCHRRSVHTRQRRQVWLECTGQKLVIRCQVADMKELLTPLWLQQGQFRICFPVEEEVTFHLGRGRVSVKMRDLRGNCLCQRDVTATPWQLQGGAVEQVLRCYPWVLRRALRMLRTLWPCDLPCSTDQADLTVLIQMTTFVGYPRDFYPCIPYEKRSLAIHRSFRSRAKALHRSEALPGMYAASRLPPVKSVRRQLFQRPGLFFYLPELEVAWDLLPDPNLFCAFLRREGVFEILSQLQMRPALGEFFRDHSRIKGCSATLALLRHWDQTLERAMDYCTMSQAMRLELQRAWKEKGKGRSARGRLPEQSLPMCHPDEAIPDGWVDGYRFAWLRSGRDYWVAGRELENCLSTWHPRNAPVVCVTWQGATVAAIEVQRGCVLQARTRNNGELSEDLPLYAAVTKWMRRYDLEWSDEEDDFFDGLPVADF